MVGKERECCAFLNFELIETSEEVRLTINSSGTRQGGR